MEGTAAETKCLVLGEGVVLPEDVDRTFLEKDCGYSIIKQEELSGSSHQGKYKRYVFLEINSSEELLVSDGTTYYIGTRSGEFTVQAAIKDLIEKEIELTQKYQDSPGINSDKSVEQKSTSRWSSWCCWSASPDEKNPLMPQENKTGPSCCML